MSGLCGRVGGGCGRVPEMCGVWGFGAGVGGVPGSGLSPVGAGMCRRRLPWCGVAVEDLGQEGAGAVFCVTCRGCVSGKAGSSEH